jgi:hypothetical protein
MRIKKLRVEIVPTVGVSDINTVEITIYTETEAHKTFKIITPDDVTSKLELFMDEAKHEMLRHLKRKTS